MSASLSQLLKNHLYIDWSHPWETRRTSRGWETHPSCSEIVAAPNKDRRSPNKHQKAIWISQISRFLADLLSHEYFWSTPQELAAPSAYKPLQCVSSTDMRSTFVSAAPLSGQPSWLQISYRFAPCERGNARKEGAKRTPGPSWWTF